MKKQKEAAVRRLSFSSSLVFSDASMFWVTENHC